VKVRANDTCLALRAFKLKVDISGRLFDSQYRVTSITKG
jgi:hypothetical protein